ncbi:MAG TPA: sulfatase-like hydrolase/transferase [Pirellulales bacterium]|nr:sulfatase-like hydrolase/transferase [Pirellulales bacterium]
MYSAACRFLGLLAPLIAPLVVNLALQANAEAAERPNFVFIYADDQRWDTIGVVQREQGDKGRFPWMESPNLDRLATDGVRFRNAFVVTSLCAPSRAAFLSGRYGHLNGVVNNHTPFPVDSVTYASVLRENGYRTAYMGKWHMGSQSGQRPGFDFSASFVGQGKYFNCPIEVNGVVTPSTGWVDDVTTDYALKFIAENKDRPFLVSLGFKTCHGPFEPPPRTAETYGDAEVREVPNLAVPAVYSAAPAKKPGKSERRTNPSRHLGMFRGLRAIDENVGKLLAKLDELKLTENTVVIYSSDNGFYLGEHGLGDKRTAYDESLRIPLLMRYPRLSRRGISIDSMVLNIDLAPTLLDFAGVKVPAQMQGRSWKPLVTGDSSGADWRHAFFYYYFRERNFAAPTVTAVRTDTAKLIRYPGHDDWTEMFDLQTDPYETHNLFADAGHAGLRRELEAEYERQAKAIGYQIPDFADEKSIPPGPQAQNAWVLDFQFEKDTGDRVVDASGHGNDGEAKGAKLVDGGRRFDGQGHISVKNSPSLDPSVGAWTVEATFQSDADDGMVLARGGKTSGYALYLKGGKPTFTYTTEDGRKTIAGKQSVEDKKVVVTATVTPGLRLKLLVDDKEIAEARLKQPIKRDPRDVMQIGADLGSPVLADKIPGFQGVIERVRLFSGEAPDAD